MILNSTRIPSTVKCGRPLTLLTVLACFWLTACEGPGPSPVPSTIKAGAPFELSAALAGLAKFQSLYTEFELEWNGSKNNLPISGSLRWEQLQRREPEAQEIYATLTQDDFTWVVASVRMDQVGWFYNQAEAPNWQPVSDKSVEALLDQVLLTPEALFSFFELQVGSPSDAERVGNLQATVYSITTADFSSESILFRQAEGTATISAEGGYLLELDFTAEVDFLESGQLLDSGEIEVAFRVPDSSSKLTVHPPALARQDIPLPADVTLPDPTPIPLSQQDQFVPPAEDQLSFQTKTDPLSVAELYLTEMPNYGWTTLLFNLPMEAPPEFDPIPLRFVREDEGVVVRIAEEEGNTEVELLFGERGTIEGNLCNAHTDCDSLTWFYFPLAPDGDIKVIMSGGGFGQLIYLTRCSAELMQQFYQAVLPAEGWTLGEAGETDKHSIYFERNSEAAELIFTSLDQGMTSVEIQSSSPTLDIWGYPGTIDLQRASEFPLAAEAQLFRLMPGQLGYQTPQAAESVVEFYQRELVAAGWSAQVAPVTEHQTTILRYQKAEMTATVLVKAGDNQSSTVWVVLYRKKAGEP